MTARHRWLTLNRPHFGAPQQRIIIARKAPSEDRHGRLMSLRKKDNHSGCSLRRSTFYV
jgi:hypothetical protein